jgi:hypothetical protein
MKLTLFHRFLLLVMVQIMFIVDIPAKQREKLSSQLYRVAMNGKVAEEDLEIFQ